MMFCLLVVSCAGFVMHSPQSQRRVHVRALRATVPESGKPSLDDPTTRDLFTKVTRAELSADLRGDVRALAEQLKASSEKRSSKLRVVAFFGVVLGAFAYWDLAKEPTCLGKSRNSRPSWSGSASSPTNSTSTKTAPTSSLSL